MAKEQVDSAEPLPPSVGNDSNKSRGIAENLVCLAFWIERGAIAFLALSFYWFPPNVWGSILFTAVGILILSNSLYLISLFSSLLQVDSAEPLPPSVGNDSNKSRGIAENLVCLAFWIERGATAFLALSFYWFPPNVWGSILFTAVGILILSNSLYLISLFSSLLQMANDRIDANASEVAEIGAATLVIATGVAIIETLRFGSLAGGSISVMPIGAAVLGAALQAKDDRNNKIDKENIGQQKAKLDLSLKESKEEVQVRDERNDIIDEEFTGQQKAKLEVSLKELKEELRSSSCRTSEEFQSLEAKYHAKYEILLQMYIDKCHGWEEERSQLMKELGAARASSEIYRELLHGSDDF